MHTIIKMFCIDACAYNERARFKNDQAGEWTFNKRAVVRRENDRVHNGVHRYEYSWKCQL